MVPFKIMIRCSVAKMNNCLPKCVLHSHIIMVLLEKSLSARDYISQHPSCLLQPHDQFFSNEMQVEETYGFSNLRL